MKLPPVPLISPAKVELPLLPPKVNALSPKLTVEPATPVSEATAVPVPLSPEMLKFAPLTAMFSAVEEESAPTPLKARLPLLIVVAPV
jgi:hypothetical protein